ncbi:hypothetical protein [Chelativorans salis]|uniref:Secreted protein n=1 Tax=Chelativorans salis TaxID=2978478 RepID=A0ABT2LPJ6_9HYPH|nr:hypothetical protein [Chelativorans sp. EGI FJ00035]MCT7376476.1 hypothetical protein [Chelativorans sp. EGI FJ00035]
MSSHRRLASGKSLAALAVLLAAAMPAFAGGEKVYADSFGNLIVRSPAGYKRIVVGKGYLAEDLAYGRHGESKVVYLEEDRGALYLRKRKSCRYGTLLHGRSYMYGLPDNVVPVPTVSCR